MGNCMSNSGNFEPPGSKAVKDFVTQHEKETDFRWKMIEEARIRAARAEQAVADAAQNGGPIKPKGPKCQICKKTVAVSINPWQRTRADILSAEISDDSEDEDDEAGPADPEAVRRTMRERRQSKLVRHGFEMKPCKHVFCGACLAQVIYQNLGVPFDPAQYGTKLATTEPAPLGRRQNFPMGCPACQVKPDEELIEMSDLTARLILGDNNMEEWNHARFLSTLNIIYCPHKGCGEAFDADDVAPALDGATYAPGLVQCPMCHKNLCKNCKSIWHENLSCEEYQALPIGERAPEDLALIELARKERWRRCPKCGAFVELKYGCNHITCTCKHHFCYVCGADFEYHDGKYHCTSGNGCQVWDEEMLLEVRGEQIQ